MCGAAGVRETNKQLFAHLEVLCGVDTVGVANCISPGLPGEAGDVDVLLQAGVEQSAAVRLGRHLILVGGRTGQQGREHKGVHAVSGALRSTLEHGAVRLSAWYLMPWLAQWMGCTACSGTREDHLGTPARPFPALGAGGTPGVFQNSLAGLVPRPCPGPAQPRPPPRAVLPAPAVGVAGGARHVGRHQRPADVQQELGSTRFAAAVLIECGRIRREGTMFRLK